ncbi:MAG: hypothetical protein K9L28_10525 [Synergistales bacterium]|nr:hypothetical protein [Synergistales bacterium]
MNNIREEEEELIRSLEQDQWERIPDYERKAGRYTEAAQKALHYHRRTSIRLW